MTIDRPYPAPLSHLSRRMQPFSERLAAAQKPKDEDVPVWDGERIHERLNNGGVPCDANTSGAG